ncbi:MAG: sulfate adenylyltransferase, partial [Verrucomicrobiae bacterium]|nr:sulfate adenylyltransferase [Verrucomicrobiae bacterium]
SFLASLLGIPHIIVAINKMDLVEYSQEAFDRIVDEFKRFASRLDNLVDITAIPISALHGDNVVTKSDKMPWYHGPDLLYHLETVYIGSDHNHVDPRFPVQWVIRPHSDEHHDYRGYAGRVAGGVFKPGDEVVVQPSGFNTKIKSIDSFEGPVEEAFAPLSVTVTLEDEIDISRGDMLVKPNNQPHKGQEIDAMICWFSDKSKLALRGKYYLRHTTKEVKAIVEEVRYKVNINTLHKIEDDLEFGLNDIGRISLRTSSPLLYDSYRRNRITGSFILIDQHTNETVAAGMIM